MGAEDFEVTAGDCGCNRIGPSLDTIGNQLVMSGMQSRDALHKNPMGAGSLDARAHGNQTLGKIADFGIACRVEDFDLASGQNCGHQGGFCRPNRGRRQHNTAAAETVCVSAGMNVATRFRFVVPVRSALSGGESGSMVE